MVVLPTFFRLRVVDEDFRDTTVAWDCEGFLLLEDDRFDELSLIVFGLDDFGFETLVVDDVLLLFFNSFG